MIAHNNVSTPTFTIRWDPSDKDYIWIAFDNILDGATQSSDDWTVPSGWTEHSTQSDATVTDSGGVSYTSANGILTSPPSGAAGKYTFTNTATLSDGRIISRSVNVIVENI